MRLDNDTPESHMWVLFLGLIGGWLLIGVLAGVVLWAVDSLLHL